MSASSMMQVAGAALAEPVRSKFTALREQISAPSMTFFMEAHNGLSAKLAEEAGFKALWASGLTISASMGLRDSNEASWTQVLEVLEYMSDAVRIPVLVDGDTGYGNFNNVRRLVRKLCARNIAGVCIEDKLFPKTNSFIGEHQPLASIDEFCGRIKAAKDTQTDSDFTVVARVEALISGRSMQEALTRAQAYREAGADAILIHSKRSTAAEIIEFARQWGRRSPLIVVPTTYYATPVEQLHEAGVSAVIWANHSLRAAITAMRATVKTIHDQRSLVGIEGQIASVKEVFRLVGCDELEHAEKRYLPVTQPARAIVLAAAGDVSGQGPKCMVQLYGSSLLQRQAEIMRKAGVAEIHVVRGYRKESVTLEGATMKDNDRFAETGEVYSLSCAEEALAGETVIVYADVLFRRFILDALLEDDADIAIAVDAARKRVDPGRVQDLVRADRRFVADYLDESALLMNMSADLVAEEVCGEWMGIARLSARGAAWVREEIQALQADGLLESVDMPMLFTRIARKHPVTVRYFIGHWMDVDTLADVSIARTFTLND